MSTSFLKSSPLSSTHGLPAMRMVVRLVHSWRCVSSLSPLASMRLVLASSTSSSGKTGKVDRPSNLLLPMSSFLREPRPYKADRSVSSFPLRLRVIRLGIDERPAQFFSLFYYKLKVMSSSCPPKLAMSWI